MLNQKIVTYLLVSLVFITLSGGFLTSFQLWVNLQTEDSDLGTKSPQFFENTAGIRHIVSSPNIFSPERIYRSNTVDEIISLAVEQKTLPPEVIIARPSLTPKPPVIEKYTNLSPILIRYSSELVLKFPYAIATKMNIRRAVARLLLSEQPFQENNLLSRQRIDLRQRPALLYHVLDQNSQTIRFPKQAYDYANYLMAQKLQKVQDEAGSFLLVAIPLHEAGLKGSARKYLNWVIKYSNKFNISPALVYAVIETESSFKPRAVSSSNAIGLMQIKDYAAGHDVYKLVYGRAGKPSRNYLFDVQNNIRMGVAYLGLLKHTYLADIENEENKNMVAISSYNGGMSTVFRLFGSNAENAIQKINTLNPQEVYRILRFEHQSAETRNYLYKVLTAEERFQELLEVQDINV